MFLCRTGRYKRQSGDGYRECRGRDGNLRQGAVLPPHHCHPDGQADAGNPPLTEGDTAVLF